METKTTQTKKRTAAIIGGGIGGLANAILLAREGYQVSVYEKNECLGGRAGILKKDGYTFDMGPSRYLMPDVFEEFFNLIGEDIHQRLDLKQLSPSYKIFYEDTPKAQGVGNKTTNSGSTSHKNTLNQLNIYSDKDRMAKMFESLEPGSGKQLLKFLDLSKIQYEIGMEFCKKNYDSLFDFFRRDIMRKGLKLNIRTTIDKYVARFFHNQLIQKVMQYTTVFLGTAPKQTPALYNIMSHVDFSMGVRYPKGGLHQVAQALYQIGLKYGISYHLDCEITGADIDNQTTCITRLHTANQGTIEADVFVANADMARFETAIIPSDYQTYPASYRNKKIFAPSGFIIYAGVNKKLPQLDHHNLYFCEDRDKNFGQIFDTKELPSDPSIYVCKISHTDLDMAPQGCENLFVLVPIPNGIAISDSQQQAYRDKVRELVEHMAGEDIRGHLDTEQIFSITDFQSRYHAWSGTALGLAHPIMQTAVFRPNNYSKKLHNLYYVGHNTNPGIGVPMVLISAQLTAQRIQERDRHHI